MKTEPVVLETLLARHKQDYFKFERVRCGGATNMFDTKVVADLAGISLESVHLVMNHYHAFRERFESEFAQLPQPTTHRVMRTIVVEEEL